MKKTFSVVSMALIAAILISGCSGRKNEESSSVPESSGTEAVSDTSNPTTSEAESVNSKIDESKIDLVQFDAEQKGPIAVMKTSMGEITLRLFPEQAPKAVENFVTHAKEGYYNGLTFHRVINDFMIQGGDPLGTGVGGESIFKNEAGEPVPFEDEFSLNLWNFRGALSMANSGANTNGSQFFIVQAPEVGDSLLQQMEAAGFPKKVIEKYKEVGGTPWLDQKHTVFGFVTSGMEVVDAIAAVEVNAQSAPTEKVIIETITIQES